MQRYKFLIIKNQHNKKCKKTIDDFNELYFARIKYKTTKGHKRAQKD